MLTIKETDDLEKIYRYHIRCNAPYFFPLSFDDWKRSFDGDVDGQGRLLFRKLTTKAAYDGDQLIGFVQYGRSAFGFDDQGELSDQVSYPIIRNLYFDADRADSGALLLKDALDDLGSEARVYAFFHYFGMSCFARHGKLFETHGHVENLLKQQGFTVEHENVYYSSLLTGSEISQVEINAQAQTEGGQQYMDFLLAGSHVGGCEIHYVDSHTAYLRWIYINGELTGQGIGTKCMEALKLWLYQQGIRRFDTDTALTNTVAQHYYEKNSFHREGISRSYYTLA